MFGSVVGHGGACNTFVESGHHCEKCRAKNMLEKRMKLIVTVAGKSRRNPRGTRTAPEGMHPFRGWFFPFRQGFLQIV